MRSKINGTVYNTEQATFIMKHDKGKIYKTRNGTYFLAIEKHLDKAGNMKRSKITLIDLKEIGIDFKVNSVPNWTGQKLVQL